MAQDPSKTINTKALSAEATNLLECKQSERQVLEKDDYVRYPYPKGVFFIIVSTFCERFNFNGIRAVLPLFMRDILLYNEDQATVIFHGFSIVCFIFPILGGMISDSRLGNFKTMLYFTLFYTIGSVLLPIAAIPNFLPQIPVSMTALFIIHMGTGVIKPCAPAFGGEQFVCPQQSTELEKFFSFFYITLNAGALIAVFVTPVLRDDVECFGEKSCFALAFGANGVFMLMSLVALISGKHFYKMKRPHRSVITEFCACIWRAITRKISAKNQRHGHWLDYAADKFDKQLIDDVKQVLSVIVVFFPLPVFWALYEQQATRMNGNLGGWIVKPEQMQIINPILTILFIPLFDHIIYPLFKRCGLLTPLQRMGSGLILCGIAFVVSAFLEMRLEPTYAKVPSEGLMKLNFINTLPCEVDIRYDVGQGLSTGVTLEPNGYVTAEHLPANESIVIQKAVAQGENCNVLRTELYKVDLGRAQQKSSYSVIVSDRNHTLTIFRMNKEERIEKSSSSNPFVGILNILAENSSSDGILTLKQSGASEEVEFYYSETNEATPAYIDYVVQTDFQEFNYGSYDVFLGHNQTIGTVENLIQGGVYRVVISPTFSTLPSYSVMTVLLTTPNTVSILWLLPQIIVMVIAEILFAVTQMTFSFTEAPGRMKSVMQAVSLLIIAFGNLIVIIVAEANFGLSQRDEFFVFSGIAGIATIIFAMLCTQYNYASQSRQPNTRAIGNPA